ncbi:MAG: exonuclease SbcCD subunit D [Gemmatimonadales bacterium]
MRLVHLSDLHLGYRQYQRLTPSGINQREADVGTAFRNAVDATIALAPEIVVVAGDVFHSVRPSNPAILLAFQQFSRLRQELPDTKIIMVAGNHDTPRSAETGCILRLFAPMGVYVVDSKPETIPFPDLNLSLLAVPYGIDPQREPDPSGRYNVLLMHTEITGVLPPMEGDADRAVVRITRDDLQAERWTYVALGHYHVYNKIAPNAFYSGSLDYTSATAWGDLNEERKARVPGKGFIEFDLDSGVATFHRVPLARALVDLPAFSARGLMAAEVDARIQEATERCAGGIDDKIVRIVVRDIPRHIVRELDHRVLREYKRRALHFQLDTRRPDVIRLHGHSAPGRRPSLADIVRDKLQGRLLEGDIDRSALVDLGLRYLADAEAMSAASLATPDVVGAEE